MLIHLQHENILSYIMKLGEEIHKLDKLKEVSSDNDIYQRVKVETNYILAIIHVITAWYLQNRVNYKE